MNPTSRSKNMKRGGVRRALSVEGGKEGREWRGWVCVGGRGGVEGERVGVQSHETSRAVKERRRYMLCWRVQLSGTKAPL